MTDVQLRRMISQWCDGSLNEQSFERLSRELRASDRARAIFVAYVQLHASLRDLIVADEDAAAMVEQACQKLSATSSRDGVESSTKTTIQESAADSAFWRVRSVLSFAIALAALVLVAAVVFHDTIDGDISEQVSALPSSVETAADSASKSLVKSPIAHVVSMSEDCKWIFDRQVRSPMSESHHLAVSPGTIVRVMEGEMTLEFINGVEVKLVGQALFGAESPMRGRVLLGKCRTTVSPGAEGYTLEAPHATVVDLGTEFGVEVDQSGEADVVVYEGAVEVNSDVVGSRSELRTSLNEGEAMRIEKGGKLSRLVSVLSDKFTSPSTARTPRSQKALILNVDDNLQRVWKYYEIVHGGMREDAKAFLGLEKQHEWNGLTRLGMPAYLVGGDYAKMFKGDQIRDDIEIRVTLNRPADVYVLFDERVPTPAWLESEFVRTGDRIGLDMGPWEGKTGDQYENARGPGNSVDRVAVVWRRREPADGLIVLGATESGVLGTEMYGVVAQPATN